MGVPAPLRLIRSMAVLLDLRPLLAYGDGRSFVLLNLCHELDAAVTVPVVVPVHEPGDLPTGLLFRC